MSAALILSLLMAAAPASPATMPPAFRGDWALETRECAVGPADSGNMRITARDIIDFESKGRIMRVEKLGPTTVRVDMKIQTGSHQFSPTLVYSLSSDGNRLTTGEMSDISRYKRCP